MNRPLIVFLAGVLVGAAGGLLAATALRGPDRSGAPSTEVAALKAEKEGLEATLAAERREHERAVERLRELLGTDLTPEAPIDPLETPGGDGGGVGIGPPEAAEAPRPTKDELIAVIRKFGGALQEIILEGGGEEAVAELRELFRRAGPEGVAGLIEDFRSGEIDLGSMTLLAHALAQSGDPAALAALTGVLADPDSGLMAHRLASHGLAFIDDESVVPALLVAAREDPDSGARANAAFGLARRGRPEGMELYAAATDEAFRKGDPAALQYLSGFALLGKTAVPAVRERLDTYKDPQARIVLIELLREQGDQESIPKLRGLVADPAVGRDVREAAEKALRQLEAR